MLKYKEEADQAVARFDAIKAEKIRYRAKIEQDESGRYVATFPDFGWRCTDGASFVEACDNASDCLASMISVMRQDGSPLPDAGDAMPREVYITAGWRMG